ncbi:DNA internalization-related competence protein ComEC/Rec2 [Endozoicomonas sp. 4G]|uniref:DNA internalization-related competence protein ComEC/Rec2 n=1 Tax=Endozoicomonas sp. 4G TaxID=2872754 RepID=UPI0020789210|nr:DNA internalization-related competence protein ComEC/Rec2 [Endozoicomonas sp. 4G]
MKHTIHLPTAYCSYLSGIVLTILFPVIPDEMSIRVIGVFSALLIMAGFLPAIAGVKVSRITVPAALNGGSGFRRFLSGYARFKGSAPGASYFSNGFSALILFYLGLGLMGIFTGFLHADGLRKSWINAEHESRAVTVTGVISDIPAYHSHLTRFDFNVKTLEEEATGHLKKIRLSWYQAPEIQAGEVWRLHIRIKHPQGNRSPGAFDREAWAARENIQATGYVKSGEKMATSDGMAFFRSRFRSAVRQWLYEHCSENSAGLLSALLIGDKSGISQQQWQWLNQTGTTHLMVISGLHIGLMAAVGFWLIMMLARTGAVPLRKITWPRYAAGAGLLFALAYAFMAGFSVPVQRALVMTGLALSGPLLGIKARPLTLFLLALCVVLSVEPLAITSAGFWYSFSAVGILLYGCCGRVFMAADEARMGGKSRAWLRPQWLVFLMLAPMLLFNQQSVSLFSPLINLVAIPVMGLLVVPVAFLALVLQPIFTSASIGVLHFLDEVFRFWDVGLATVSSVPVFVPVVSIGLVQVVLMVCAVLILATPMGLGLRALSLFFLLPLLFPIKDYPETGAAKVAVLDVGQGIAVLLQTRQHTLLYDTGVASRGRFNSVDGIIVPYLNRLGVDRVDRVMISHGDNDHSGGLERIHQRYPEAEIISGSAVTGFEGAISPCLPGMKWQWDGVAFEVLSGSRLSVPDNERSCVLRVTAGRETLLLTGDIGKKTESYLVSQLEGLEADYLLLPHHGSRFSGSQAFLFQVNPSQVLVSSGYRNRFGHPAGETLDRIEQLGATLYNTATSGTLSFVMGKGPERVKQYKHQSARYWWR